MEGRERWAAWALFVGAAAIYAVGLGSLEGIRHGDEAYYLTVIQEMRDRGSWLVPLYNGGPSYIKPPLHYWAAMISAGLFGPSLFALRLPSALAAAGVVALTYRLAADHGSRRRALLAALVTGTTMGAYRFGRAAMADALLALCTLTAVLACARAARGKPRWLWLAGAALGASALLKWPGAAVVPALAGMGALKAHRRLDLVWSREALGALGGALLVAGPWYLASLGLPVFMEDLLHETFSARFGGKREGLFVLAGLLSYAAPWSLLVAAGVLSLWRSHPIYYNAGSSRRATIVLEGMGGIAGGARPPPLEDRRLRRSGSLSAAAGRMLYWLRPNPAALGDPLVVIAGLWLGLSLLVWSLPPRLQYAHHAVPMLAPAAILAAGALERGSRLAAVALRITAVAAAALAAAALAALRLAPDLPAALALGAGALLAALAARELWRQRLHLAAPAVGAALASLLGVALPRFDAPLLPAPSALVLEGRAVWCAGQPGYYRVALGRPGGRVYNPRDCAARLAEGAVVIVEPAMRALCGDQPGAQVLATWPRTRRRIGLAELKEALRAGRLEPLQEPVRALISPGDMYLLRVPRGNQ